VEWELAAGKKIFLVAVGHGEDFSGGVGHFDWYFGLGWFGLGFAEGELLTAGTRGVGWDNSVVGGWGSSSFFERENKEAWRVAERLKEAKDLVEGKDFGETKRIVGRFPFISDFNLDKTDYAPKVGVVGGQTLTRACRWAKRPDMQT